MKLKDLLKTFDENQYVDICCDVDKGMTLKTIYYGRAKILHEEKNVLEGFEKFEVKNTIAAYIDDVIKNEQRAVIMIILKEG